MPGIDSDTTNTLELSPKKGIRQSTQNPKRILLAINVAHGFLRDITKLVSIAKVLFSGASWNVAC